MNFTLYEGDFQGVPVKNTSSFIPGEFVMEMVMYCAKEIGTKNWYGVLSNGETIEIAPVRSKLQRVGWCKFYYDFTLELYRHIHKKTDNQETLKQLMNNRKRKLWEKEYRRGLIVVK